MTLVLAATGCGGGKLSHSDYVKRADAVCKAYAGATKPLTHPRSYADVIAYVKQTLPLYEAALRKLRALEPPSNDAAAVRTWLAADRRVAGAIRALGVAAQRRDFPAVSAAASRAQLAGSASRRSAASLGMQVCARIASGR
ncbi:MAG: hypothetical protein QOF43_2426 [Gaiellaceae bacterium]|jgi:hypothetical protein|nr:hypothetical protein [Gaiellaceae bacterium]